ncbi:hypothetical protein B0H19DRAFT_1179691 [Mycena capillaripes]|nr:hypothetical protein B0H19DRAFT_1179691 [Mycena capillaripes]
MGRSPTVVISAQTVVELAKSAVVPIRCDVVPFVPHKPGTINVSVGNPCGQELGSWKLFLKHQLKKHISKRKGVYTCGLNKCSAKIHGSMDSLRAHVESSHMKNVPLPCPFANCKPHIPDFGRPTPYNMFLREKDLLGHLSSSHPHLIGRELDLRSEQLLPGWEPCSPIRPLPVPPDLPSGKIPTATFRLESVPPPRMRSYAWMMRLDAEGTSSSSSTLAPPPPTSTPTPTPSLIPLTPKTPAGRGRGLLRTSSLIRTSSPDPEPDTEPDYDFADLPAVYYDEDARNMVPASILRAPNFIVQRAGGDFADHADLVRSLPMLQAPMPETPPPPTSIFHEALRQQVFLQYALGEDAVTDFASVALPEN